MKQTFLLGGAATILVFTAISGWYFLYPSKEIQVGQISAPLIPQKTKEELIAEALEKSSEIKALYMTADVANDQGAGATRLRKKLIEIVDTTEINGLVIDVKEVCGPDYTEGALKKLLTELREKNIWSIARIVVFKDDAQFEAHPDWYLTRKNYRAAGKECIYKKHLRVKPADGKKPDVVFWQDKRGGYWLDPAHPEARNYILEFSKKMIDLGFNELQYDYLRFPSDGDVEKAIYPFWDGKTPKYMVMKNLFEFLNKNLKEYKPDIILSADLFGYAAILAGDVGIGQRLEDIEDSFDYISFMVYPSHYYSGLYLPADPTHNLPAVNFTFTKARVNPGEVVYRSLLLARDFLDGKISTSTTGMATSTAKATSTVEIVENPKPRSQVRLRPWLEDFFHEDDKAAGRPYGIEKVRLQIEAAEKAEKHGWMLWNAANVYTEGALKKQ